MMKEIFPNMHEDSAEYGIRSRSIKRPRKLGQRLYSLKTRFGYGILGLLPCSDSSMTVEWTLSVTDNMYVQSIASFDDETD